MSVRSAFIAISVLVVLAATASAGQGATLTTDSTDYGYVDSMDREVVRLNFSNHGEGTLFLPNAAPFRILREGEVAYEAGSIDAIHAIPAGVSYYQDWDMTTTCGVEHALARAECLGIATPGRYSAKWIYFTTYPFTSPVVLTTEFEIALFDGVGTR